jgi:hypothetical protein
VEADAHALHSFMSHRGVVDFHGDKRAQAAPLGVEG